MIPTFKIDASRLILSITFFFLIQISSSFAVQADFTGGILDRTLVMKSAKTVTRANYPNADVVELDRHKWIKYNKDGTFVEWCDYYTKILTERGKRRFKTISSSFTIPYNTTVFKLVEVIKDDGRVVVVDLDKNSNIMIENGQMNSNIYNPNSKILRINIPELDLGDTVHYLMFDNFTKVRTPETWSDYVGFESTDPIKRSEYTVVAPREKPLKSIIFKSEIPGTITHEKRIENNCIVYNWIAGDVPCAFTEPEMPPFYTQMQRLLISTIEDWGWISRWYWNLCKPQIEKTTPAMKMTVEQLIKGCDNPYDKIKAVFFWVSQEIRYLGITVEKDSPGYEPHPVDMTFDRRAGVCRDKAALLTAMLRLAAFDAYPVLIMNGPKKDPEVPQPFFNHAITCVRESDGSYLLMDSTDENTKEIFPAYLNNQSYLVATPAGETLRTSPIEPAEGNMMHIETKGVLDKDGNLDAESILHFYGINDNVYRGYFSRLTLDERRGYFEKITKAVVPGARLISCKIFPDNMLDTTNPLVVYINFEAGDIRVPGKEICMLPILRAGSKLGMVNHLLGKMGLKKRRYPLRTKFACGVKETLELDIKESVGKLISLPKNEVIENEGIDWIRNFSLKDNLLLCENVFRMKLPEYTADQYLTLKRALKKIEEKNRTMPIFSNLRADTNDNESEWYASLTADAVVLEEEVEYDVKDAHNWSETKKMKIKILTYAGKKKNSDIYITYNPIWEDVEIKNAVVTSKSGETKVIENQEINIMDAEWVGDAPRYPAAKTMVVSFPGVEVGSIIEYTVVRKKKNRPFFSINGEFYEHNKITNGSDNHKSHSFFSINGTFRYHNPLTKKTLRLKISDRLRLNISQTDQGVGLEKIWKRKTKKLIKKNKERSGDRIVYEFVASKIEPVEYENFLPPWYSFNPMVFISTGNWHNYAEQVRQVLQKAASSHPLVMDRAREIVGGFSNKEDEITAIRDFVSRNINPINLSINDLPLEQVTPAERTLMDGYGSSADRAVLLYALLSAAGYNPEFVLASRILPVENLQRLIREYPVPGIFNQALVRLKKDEGYIYLNDTDQYAALGTTSNDGHLGLLLKTGQIFTISALTEGLKDREDLIFSIRLFKDGRAIIKKKRTVYGKKFAAFRKKFTEMPPEKRNRYHQERVASISQSAEADGEYVTNYNMYPGVEEFSVKVDNYATRQGDCLYLKLPGLTTGIMGVKRDERKNPMYRDWFCRRHVKLEVTLPEGIDSFQIIPPQTLFLPVERSGEINMETKFLPPASPSRLAGPKRLSVQMDIDLKPVVVLPKEYLQLLEINRILSHPETRMLLIKMKR